MKNILVIGPTSAIAKFYIDQNKLNKITNFSFSDRNNTIQSLQELIRNQNIDSVLYFSNHKSNKTLEHNVRETSFINVELPIKIAEICQKFNSQLLVFSSTRIFDENKPFADKKSLYSAGTDYGQQKIDLELGVLQYNSKVLRLTKVLTQDDELWLNWSRSIKLGIPTRVYKNKYISPVFLHEVALAIDKVLGLIGGNIFQFSRSTEISYETLFKKFVDYSAKKIHKPINLNNTNYISSTETHSSLICDDELIDCLGNFDIQYEEFVNSLN